MRIIIAILCFAATLFSGCQNEFTENPSHENCSTLTISLESSRTSLGAKVGDSYPVYWSEGDRIAINGAASGEAVINAENRSVATFDILSPATKPFHITYPYSESLSGAASKVIFPAEQRYTEGTFAQGCAPMCGYINSNSSDITLKHLAAVLRLPIKASSEGTTLEKVVVTSLGGAKISGVFDVDCTSATIVADANATNSTTYLLPDNFALSTTNESTLHIAIPAVEVGNCSIEFIESSGKKMTCSWKGGSLKAGVVKEFKTISYKRGTVGTLTPMEAVEDVLTIYYPTIAGYVKDTNGNPISGVAVSDGFQVVATNDKGYYSMDVTRDCRYIYISLPAEYEVPINEFGQPCFYIPYPSGTNLYNFTLKPLAGGKEKKFALFTFADPQVSKATSLSRLNTEAIPEIFAHSQELKAQGILSYGITLGDIISNGDSTNSGAFRDDMRDAFAVSNSGMPVFQVMGNHDNTYFNSSQPLFTDERSSTFELKAQREHEDMFGPVNYSFNRGDVHIIGMRDIVYRYNTTSASYATGFLPEQVEWLKQDLALVPKSKMVVLCVHIQLFNGTSNHTQEVLSLLDQYKEAHVLSGHIHRQQLYDHTTQSGSSHKVYEHNTNAVCGSWWSANISGDGTPNGYNVFVGEGNTFSDWYYMGFNKGMNTRSHQMRLYRGNAVTGGPIEGSNSYGIKGYYAFNFADDVLLANVYNADSKWKIEVYEDGVYSGNMTSLPTTAPSFSTLVGDYTISNPRRAKDGVVTGSDFYAAGLHLGILGRWSSSKNAPANGAYNTCWHMYQYKLKNKNAKIKVVAIDRFGNKYTEEKITEGTDYTLVKKPE